MRFAAICAVGVAGWALSTTASEAPPPEPAPMVHCASFEIPSVRVDPQLGALYLQDESFNPPLPKGYLPVGVGAGPQIGKRAEEGALERYVVACGPDWPPVRN